ncbi:MAG: penicillin-binding protein 2 [Nitrospinota bacterium]|nr:penicillin-binding protein 2 [Nitrospinota bacterium]
MLRTRPEWEDFLRKRRGKIRVFGAALAVACLVIMIRLWHLQVIEYSSLAGRAESNRIRQLTLDGQRGLIVDRDGKVLVDTRPSFRLSVVPEDTPHPKSTLEYLSKKIKVDINSALARIKEVRSFTPVVLNRDMDRNSVAFVEERRFELPGVALEIKPTRHYPHADFAAHVLGYLGSITAQALTEAEGKYAMGDFVGQTGLEKEYEEILRGRKGLKRVEVDAAGRELATLAVEPPKSGHQLKLTMDFMTQKAAEAAFADYRGAAVALDPNTGEVLAFVSKPSFDPNLFTIGISPKEWNSLVTDPAHPLQNRVTHGQYPPGSTFKIAVALAALEEGITTPEREIKCPGYFQFGIRKFRCWNKHGHGTVNLHKAIVESCDVYFYTVGTELGVEKLERTARRLGLGLKTGIRLGGERTGLIPTKEWKLAALKEPWHPGEMVSCAIGQGYVLATPLQLALMTAAVANWGRMVTPTLTVVEQEGRKQNAETGRINISKESVRLVREAMRGVVADPHGTAWRLRNGPYQYAGKTGTAQVVRMREEEPVSEEDVAEHLRDHALFIAFAPYDDPKIAVAVVVENSGHGGEVAAPIAKIIMDTYLARLPEVKRMAKPKPKPQPAAPPAEAPAETTVVVPPADDTRQNPPTEAPAEAPLASPTPSESMEAHNP